ncbi:MAG: hypothetical protein GXO75_01405, partial [Calditrichaeota bacterium]|nr:hypothetical protein [Calditrichota bacterium]
MNKRTALVFSSLILGLAWALRGNMGHDPGAAWAGALGAMAIIVAAKRTDWFLRLPAIAAIAAIGWGVGGSMSYIHVVGYGWVKDFANVYYGLAMLGVIGALWAFIGGGFFGLCLETTDEKKPDWPSLLTLMIAGGILMYQILIVRYGWKMNPPRVEYWATCLGAAGALAWFLYRNGYFKALRVAGYSAFGAGFGFAFGNFLQTLASASGIVFRYWNLMEFTLGF